MSDTEFLIVVIVAPVIIGGFILFAIWQYIMLRKSENYNIDPRLIAPFKEYSDIQIGWFVARERQWPPIKCNIVFRRRWSFVEIQRVRDQCGQVSVYHNNQDLIGHINIYNKYQSYIECNGKEIHAIPEIANFTNFCKRISYILTDNGNIILALEPYLNLGQTTEYPFTINGKSYVFACGLSSYRSSATLFCEGVKKAIFAVVTAKHITAAIVLSETDYLVLLLCFEIFNRRIS